MSDIWKHKQPIDFFESVDSEGYSILPRRILLTTFGLDIDFVWSHVLSRLLCIKDEFQSNAWYLTMSERIKNCDVIIIGDGNECGRLDHEHLLRSFGGHILTCSSDKCQHSKLWLVEYESEYEMSKIAIGSTNLTTVAFTSQIQYNWEQLISLSHEALDSSVSEYQYFYHHFQEPLALFLGELFANAACSKQGEHQEIQNIEDGLIDCIYRMLPFAGSENVRVISNVPNHEKPSAIQQLSDSKDWLSVGENTGHLSVDIQVFSTSTSSNVDFIREFKQAWSLASDGQLNLYWPSEQTVIENPAWKGMKLSSGFLSALKEGGAGFYKLNIDEKKVSESNERLPHGKFYGLFNSRRGGGNSEGKYDAMLIGSSNFSCSAWKGKNFELNVLQKGIDTKKWVDQVPYVDTEECGGDELHVDPEHKPSYACPEIYPRFYPCRVEGDDTHLNLILDVQNALFSEEQPARLQLETERGARPADRVVDHIFEWEVHVKELDTTARFDYEIYNHHGEVVLGRWSFSLPSVKQETVLENFCGITREQLDDFRLSEFGWRLIDDTFDNTYRVYWIEQSKQVFKVVDRLRERVLKSNRADEQVKRNIKLLEEFKAIFWRKAEHGPVGVENKPSRFDQNAWLVGADELDTIKEHEISPWLMGMDSATVSFPTIHNEARSLLRINNRVGEFIENTLKIGLCEQLSDDAQIEIEILRTDSSFDDRVMRSVWESKPFSINRTGLKVVLRCDLVVIDQNPWMEIVRNKPVMIWQACFRKQSKSMTLFDYCEYPLYIDQSNSVYDDWWNNGELICDSRVFKYTYNNCHYRFFYTQPIPLVQCDADEDSVSIDDFVEAFGQWLLSLSANRSERSNKNLNVHLMQFDWKLRAFKLIE